MVVLFRNQRVRSRTPPDRTVSLGIHSLYIQYMHAFAPSLAAFESRGGGASMAAPFQILHFDFPTLLEGVAVFFVPPSTRKTSLKTRKRPSLSAEARDAAEGVLCASKNLTI